jgi:hypothetical protein
MDEDCLFLNVDARRARSPVLVVPRRRPDRPTADPTIDGLTAARNRGGDVAPGWGARSSASAPPTAGCRVRGVGVEHIAAFATSP